MRQSRAIRACAMALLAGTLTMGGGAAAQGASPGVIKASPKVVAQIAAGLGLTLPPECLGARLARSDRTWAVYSVAMPVPAGCPISEGDTVVHKVKGTWESVPAGGSSVPCSDYKKALKKAGAPSSVYRDFKAGGYCTPDARRHERH